MATTEKIETTRFLGSEFLLWLWSVSEICSGEVPFRDGELLPLWFDTQLSLRDPLDNSEKVELKGVAPSNTPEAKLALARGKLPIKAQLTMLRQQEEIRITLEAETLSISSIRAEIPEVENSEEMLETRLLVLSQIDEMVHRLYREFLNLRIGASWPEFRGLLLRWHRGDDVEELCKEYRVKFLGLEAE